MANNSSPEKGIADEAIRRAFAKASSWRTPPHWSRCDWLDEVYAILQSGAACAGLQFDEERGVPLRAYIYLRAVAAAWTRYRQEWSYYLHCVMKSNDALEISDIPRRQSEQSETTSQLLSHALYQLTEEDRLLVHRLFWDGAQQCRVAASLQISQQCVSKRKSRILRQLRRLLASGLLPNLLTFGWALLDGLDLLPVIDFL